MGNFPPLTPGTKAIIAALLALALYWTHFIFFRTVDFHAANSMSGDFWSDKNSFTASLKDEFIPQQLPGPMDIWAGGEEKELLVEAPCFWRGAVVNIHFYDTHEAFPPTLSISADGAPLGRFQLEKGKGLSAGKWFTEGKRSKVEVPPFACGWPAANVILSIRNVGGSWGAMEKISIHPVAGILEYSLLAAGWILAALISIYVFRSRAEKISAPEGPAIISGTSLWLAAIAVGGGGVLSLLALYLAHDPDLGNSFSIPFFLWRVPLTLFEAYAKYKLETLAFLFAANLLLWRWGARRMDIHHKFAIASLLMASLAVLMAWNLRGAWGAVDRQVDSSSYINAQPARTYLYPAFIHAFTGGNIAGGAEKERGALVNVARGQKLVAAAAFLFFIVCLTLYAPPALTAPLGLYLWLGGYVTPLSSILTEPLAQAWIFLLAGVFALFARYGVAPLIPLAGLLCGIGYLIRPAEIFMIVLPAVMIFMLWRRKGIKGTWSSASIAIALFAAAVLSQIICTFTTYGVLTPSPMYNQQRMAFALQVAEPSDIGLMPDELSGLFFKRSLERKHVEDKSFRGSRDPKKVAAFEYLDTNVYQVAYPVAREILKGHGLEPGAANFNELFGKVSGPILARHWDKRGAIFIESLNWALYEETFNLARKGALNWFIGLFMIALILACREHAAISLGLMLAHAANIIVICMYNFPMPRYYELTEFAFPASLVLMAYSILRKAEEKVFRLATDSASI
ncbi:MAG: hypothetical protein HZB29_11175 [Nitrospinae bacterium]|nr:hypothetical protein [Nitrospinota bacterium]